MWCVQLRVVRFKWDCYERERGGFDWQRQVEVSEKEVERTSREGERLGCLVLE